MKIQKSTQSETLESKIENQIRALPARKGARILYTESLEIEKKLGNQSGVSTSLFQPGLLSEGERDLETATLLFGEALSSFEKLESPIAEIARQALERVSNR